MSQTPAELKYAKSHEWVRVEADGTLTLGITDHAQSALGDLVFVELPKIGRKLAAGEACAVVESVKAASDVYAPVAGEVIETNPALADAPEAINTEPYAGGWMWKMKPSEAGAVDRLLDAAGYTDWRLPTAAELSRFSPFFHSHPGEETSLETKLSTDQEFDWRWKVRASKAHFERLYPELCKTGVRLWTATGLGGGLAWAYDGSMPAGDHKVGSLMGVLFVRRLTGGEFQAPTTIDEDVSW